MQMPLQPLDPSRFIELDEASPHQVFAGRTHVGKAGVVAVENAPAALVLSLNWGVGLRRTGA
jgi:hypothetical protein